jgi:hypothetical protein
MLISGELGTSPSSIIRSSSTSVSVAESLVCRHINNQHQQHISENKSRELMHSEMHAQYEVDIQQDGTKKSWHDLEMLPSKQNTRHRLVKDHSAINHRNLAITTFFCTVQKRGYSVKRWRNANQLINSLEPTTEQHNTASGFNLVLRQSQPASFHGNEALEKFSHPPHEDEKTMNVKRTLHVRQE